MRSVKRNDLTPSAISEARAKRLRHACDTDRHTLQAWGTNTMTIKAVMFDLDGTLVDSNDMHVLAWEEAFLGVGRAFDQTVIHDQIGKGADMLIPSLVPALDEEVRQTLGNAQGAIFRGRCRRPPTVSNHAWSMRQRAFWLLRSMSSPTMPSSPSNLPEYLISSRSTVGIWVRSQPKPLHILATPRPA
jgi:hypothetical protein